jgi:hypothetical protein
MRNKDLDTLAWMVSLIGFAVSVGVWQHSTHRSVSRCCSARISSTGTSRHDYPTRYRSHAAQELLELHRCLWAGGQR